MSQVAALSSAGTIIEDALNIDDASIVVRRSLITCSVHTRLALALLFAHFEKVSTLNNSLICSSAFLSARRHFSKTKRQRWSGKNQERCKNMF